MYFLDVMAQLRFNSFPEACTPFVLKFCVWNLDKQVPISHVDEGEDSVEGGHHQILNLITSKPISHVDEGEDGVEGGHHHVCDGQVQEEVVCHTPHSSVS